MGVDTLVPLATQCPPVVLVWMTLTSYRVHSVFVLRLFNDPLAMVLLYMAIALFMANRWAAGCVLYRYACVHPNKYALVEFACGKGMAWVGCRGHGKYGA